MILCYHSESSYYSAPRSEVFELRDRIKIDSLIYAKSNRVNIQQKSRVFGNGWTEKKADFKTTRQSLCCSLIKMDLYNYINNNLSLHF